MVVINYVLGKGGRVMPTCENCGMEWSRIP